MLRVVALTSGRVASSLSPNHGQVLSDVESSNLDKCESYRSVKLVKPPSLDKCCSGWFCQVVQGGGGHVFCIAPKLDVLGEGSPYF